MFKHEVVKCLCNFEPYFKNYGTLNIYGWLKNALNCATEVYGGSSLNYEDLCDKTICTRSISYDSFHPPFQYTLVSYEKPDLIETTCIENKAKKRSILVYRDETAIQFFSFLKRDSMKDWMIDKYCGIHFANGAEQNRYTPIHLWGKNFESSEETFQDFIMETLIVKSIFDVLSCKNVSLTPVDPPEKLNKKRIKKGKKPLCRYHVLTVDLDKGRKQSGVGRGANLGTMPVHLCRGHFKEYTTEKPLFGRVTGRFWWQPYARGKAENGVVMKDYEIKKSNV